MEVDHISRSLIGVAVNCNVTYDQLPPSADPSSKPSTPHKALLVPYTSSEHLIPPLVGRRVLPEPKKARWVRSKYLMTLKTTTWCERNNRI